MKCGDNANYLKITAPAKYSERKFDIITTTMEMDKAIDFFVYN